MKIESIIENTIKSVPGIIDIVPLDKNISDNPFLITVNNEKQVSVYFGVIILSNSYAKTIVEEIQERIIYELDKNNYKLLKLEIYIKGTKNE
ncbi:hypothetical protein LQ356_00430 [Metamycoplasma faucium]|uniref:MIP18 family-like domain-containing protein n=1 Tax=Metamycoplasma faucium TaxID=56142 RepID=A0ABZ2TLM7_9BACT